MVMMVCLLTTITIQFMIEMIYILQNVNLRQSVIPKINNTIDHHLS